MRRGFRAEWKAEIRGVLKGLAAVWAGLAVFILLVPLLVVWGSGGFDTGGAGDGQHAGDAAGGGGQGAAQTAQVRAADRVKTPRTIKVWREELGKAVKVDFEEYVACVTASEMPNTFETEALKAQSVAARTFAMAKLQKYETKKPKHHPKAPICDTTHCQVYKTEKELIVCHPDGWGDSENGWPKVRAACKSTEGQLLYYDGKLVMQPLFFSSSGGQTENSEDVFVSAVPYLVSVSSPYEENATHRNEQKTFTLAEMQKKLQKSFPEKDFGRLTQSNVKILSRTAGGRVERMQVGEQKLKGTQVRSALGLSSALFSISFDGANIVFTSSGSGHGVGMSQYGANGMAKEGNTYREILQHYYAGTAVG